MVNKIPRTIFDISKDDVACVADLSHEPEHTASELHYLMMSKKEVKRLHNLDSAEQVSIWRYAEELALKAVNAKGINNIAILLNEGYASGQTVGHLHVHIVGFKDTESYNLEKRLNDLLKKFNKQPLTYIDRLTINCRISELGELIPQYISQYLNEDYGFSLLSEMLFNNPLEPQNFVLQIFSKEYPRSYGLTNLTRVMNGFREEPIDWPSKNKDAVFDFIKTKRDSARALVITPENKICLIKRNKHNQDYWVTPGGGIEPNETPLEAITRELREEIGAQLSESSCQLAFKRESDGGNLYFFICHETEPRTIPEGPEHKTYNPDNRYEVKDLFFQELSGINLLPEDIKDYIVSSLKINQT